MAQTLYRKYRPQTFAEVVNQEHIKTTLTNAVKTGSVAHAYLFSGSRGIGKTSLARIFAKALNCTALNKKTGEPCSSCLSCKSFAAGTFLDVIEIDAASHTGVDTVREIIIDSARLMPALGAYKVFIIDEVHMLSTSAFNALLKIIEEPPAHVVFIFATTESMKIPATIVSRCQRFDFKKITQEHIVERLAEIVKREKRKVDTDVLKAVARYADGALRDAEGLLGQVLTLSDEKITLEHASLLLPISHLENVRVLATYIIEGKTAEAITYVGTAVENGINLEQFTLDLLELWRLALLMKIGAVNDLADLDHKKWIESVDAQTSVEQLRTLLELTTKAIIASRNETGIITLPLELFIVEATTKE